MRLRIYSDDDIELTTATVAGVEEIEAVLRSQFGVGDEQWTITQYDATRYECTSGGMTVWVCI